MKYCAICLILTLLSASAYAGAEDPQSNLEMTKRMQTACADKDQGDLCEFENNKGDNINGQCQRGSDLNTTLACVPTS